MLSRVTVYLLLASLIAPAGAARAAQLCGAQCELAISFPSGGRLVAQRPVTFTFGAGGLIDTVGSVTAYLDGETLTLGSGGRLDFGSGGSLDLGDGGNIDFTDLEIFTTGDFDVAAVGGSETIEVAPGSILSVFGGADLVFEAATVSIGGGLELSANGTLGMFNDIATGCGITPKIQAVRISLATVAVTADNTACQRLLATALVENIDPGGSDDPPPVSDEPSDATAFAPWLAAFLLLLAAAGRRRSEAKARG